MIIAVTGGGGLIGRELLKTFPENYEILVLSRNRSKSNSVHLGLNIRYVKTDYTVESLRNILNGSDSVIHLAAQRLQKMNADKSFRNVQIDYNIFKACESLNIRNIVFTSSCGVYGKNPNTPWSEEDKLSPENPYSLGKCLSEKTAEYFIERGLSIKCLRLAHVLSTEARKEYMLGTFLERALKGETIELYGTEDQKREYIYVKDVARGIFATLIRPEIKGVFNLGSEEVISIPKLAKMINRIFQNVSPIIKRESHNKPQKEFSLMDSGLFYSTFDFQPSWTIRDALIDMFNNTESFERNSHIR